VPLKVADGCPKWRPPRPHPPMADKPPVCHWQACSPICGRSKRALNRALTRHPQGTLQAPSRHPLYRAHCRQRPRRRFARQTPTAPTTPRDEIVRHLAESFSPSAQSAQSARGPLEISPLFGDAAGPFQDLFTRPGGRSPTGKRWQLPTSHRRECMMANLELPWSHPKKSWTGSQFSLCRVDVMAAWWARSASRPIPSTIYRPSTIESTISPRSSRNISFISYTGMDSSSSRPIFPGTIPDWSREVGCGGIVSLSGLDI
jgi:hypothetical protein